MAERKFIQKAIKRPNRIRMLLGKKEGERITIGELRRLRERLRREGKLDRSISSAISLAERFVGGDLRRAQDGALVPEDALSELEALIDEPLAAQEGAMTTSERPHKGGALSPEKACQILKDGEVGGKPLTDKQRRFFGLLCGRGAPGKAQEGAVVSPSLGQALAECLLEDSAFDPWEALG